MSDLITDLAIIKTKLHELLSHKKVGLIIGFEKYQNRSRPLLISNTADIDRIIIDEDAPQNLAVYLKKSTVRKLFPVVILGRSAEKRSIELLIRENQIKQDDVVFIETPDSQKRKDFLKMLDQEIERLWKLRPEERLQFWQEHMDKCIRCYACRQSCPQCYCAQCIVNKNRPQWIETSAHLRGNFSWNMTRAFHLAGRCVECGACETACPQNIPLMLLNRMQAEFVRQTISGTNNHTDGEAADKSLFSDWSKDDDNSFFL